MEIGDPDRRSIETKQNRGQGDQGEMHDEKEVRKIFEALMSVLRFGGEGEARQSL